MRKLSTVAKDLNISKMTLWNWMYQGKIKFTKIGSLNYIDDDTYNTILGIQKKPLAAVIYTRVSSSEQKDNLDRQTQRLISYCNAKGYKVDKVVSEIGSGLNDNRPKLQKLLKDQDFSMLVVEHKDRLTRFGFNYIETMLKKNDIIIDVVNNVDDEKQDLVQDFVSVITSFSARIYGQRRSKRKTEQIIKSLEHDQNLEENTK